MQHNRNNTEKLQQQPNNQQVRLSSSTWTTIQCS